MCHEHRQFRVVDNVAGGAAKDHLPQSALGVGALDQEVSAQRLRVGQNRLTRHAAIKTYGQRFCRHPVQLQIAAQLLPRAPVLGFSLVARATHSLADIDNSAPTTAPTMYMAQAERLIGVLVDVNMKYSPRSAIPKLPAIASFIA